MRTLKKHSTLFLRLSLVALLFTGHYSEAHEAHQAQEDDSSVLSSEQEQLFRERLEKGDLEAFGSRFPQTGWRECSDDPTGNYTGARCASSRGISVILKQFMSNYIYDCVDDALRAVGLPHAKELHVVHKGIQGDRNHSPRSLHAEARAIDVDSFEVTLSSGVRKTFKYEGTSNRTFYTAFRQCWGRVVNRENGCPFIRGESLLTGSIGWEDSRHLQHMHTSVPYCVNGRYAGDYFQR